MFLFVQHKNMSLQTGPHYTGHYWFQNTLRAHVMKPAKYSLNTSSGHTTKQKGENAVVALLAACVQ